MSTTAFRHDLLPVLPLSGDVAERANQRLEALIAEISELVAGIEAATRLQSSTPLREPLTDREIRILRYLPTNLSKREIGDELSVSVETIKTHVRHIYAKLDVQSRRQAVDRARTLGLLTHSARIRSA